MARTLLSNFLSRIVTLVLHRTHTIRGGSTFEALKLNCYGSPSATTIKDWVTKVFFTRVVPQQTTTFFLTTTFQILIKIAVVDYLTCPKY